MSLALQTGGAPAHIETIRNMDPKELKIVYLGTPDFAVMPLRKLVEEGYRVVAVVTSPDKPAGRGLKMQQSAVKQYALSVGLPVLQPEKLKDPAFVETFRALDADLGIVIAFRMLPEIIWAAPRLGTFNLHASLLPDYRGAAPINWAVINGETETGVTTFMLNHEIDKGDILGRTRVAIEPLDDVGSLHDKLMVEGTDLVLQTVERIARGEATPIPQIESQTDKPAPKIFKETCHIDWHKSVTDTLNLIRGLSPYPGAWCELETIDDSSVAPQTLKIYRAHIEHASAVTPGQIRTDGKKELSIACADGWLHIEQLQLAGKKRMSTEELLRGFKSITAYRAR